MDKALTAHHTFKKKLILSLTLTNQFGCLYWGLNTVSRLKKRKVQWNIVRLQQNTVEPY